MTAWLLAVSVNRYVKLTFLFGPVRKSLEPVGRWTESRNCKFWHSRLCHL